MLKKLKWDVKTKTKDAKKIKKGEDNKKKNVQKCEVKTKWKYVKVMLRN